MHRAYLARHLFDSKRLRKHTSEEFTAAVRTGRLIAFVGSWATTGITSFPYPSWKAFLKRYAKMAVAKASACDDFSPLALKAIKAIQESLTKKASTEEALASLSVIESAIAYGVPPGQALSSELRTAAANLFRLKGSSTKKNNNVQQVLRGLAIDRVITLNYDLEFEWELMTTASEKDELTKEPGESSAGKRLKTRQDLFDRLRLNDNLIVKDIETLSLTRSLPSGQSIISDVFSRDRTDRLIEFAVGSPDQDAHILHLHGRVTDAEGMVISQSDYNRQYRRSGVSRLPFEHALRMLFSGNPILFVGVGMTEGEVTSTLEQFVSDHPGRRTSSAFVLWNSPPTEKEKDTLRFRWLHRFGVLTLFDDELSKEWTHDRLHLADKKLRVTTALGNLATASAGNLSPFEWQKDDFRSVAAKLAEALAIKPQRLEIWGTRSSDADDEHKPLVADQELRAPEPVLVFIGEPGSGKGQLAREIRDKWHDENPDGRSCLVNASFVFETDSMFSLISGLADGDLAADGRKSRGRALGEYLQPSQDDLEPSQDDQDLDESAEEAAPVKLLIIINGMERFFSPGGAPLSSELDALVRKIAALARRNVSGEGSTAEAEQLQNKRPAPPDFKIVLLGTARVRRYLDGLDRAFQDTVHYARDFSKAHPTRGPHADARTPSIPTGSTYLDFVLERFATREVTHERLWPAQQALIEQKREGERGGARRAVLAAYLDPERLDQALGSGADLCLDILTVMAFIGQPVEDAVLRHAPRIAKHWAPLDAGGDGAIKRALDDLLDLGLIIEINGFPETPLTWRRFGLHRSVLAELRDRHGVPLSDSQLSAGFNLSIFAAQPADGYSPEREIHEELGKLVDWLIGAYKDFLDPKKELPAADGTSVDEPEDEAPNRSRALPQASACLRAALAVVRSYYSTSTLLTLDRSERHARREEDGPLTEHADRLDRLLSAARACAVARRKAEPDKPSSPPPFYPDDLVWIENECGVVRLAQGDLYEARRAFEAALRLNREHVEFADRGPNWRRITLNQIHVDIERGALDRAESRMDQIEEAIRKNLDVPFAEVRTHIVNRYASGVRRVHIVDPIYAHDVVLTTALIFGYRGLSLHLRGELRGAGASFEKATSILDNIGEQRAYSLFQRHHASLLSMLNDVEGSAKALRLSVASAEATRQTDIAYHARIAQAQHRHQHRDSSLRPALMRELQSALLYAEAGDMHRVRVEAGLNLARIKLTSGDHDAALEHAADAMAIATRYGLSLRKISLRILMGQILIKRGDPHSGRALLDRAIRNADRVNYQRAVELAQNVLAEEASLGD
jgi:tetratricopeptide (TPR) repeat protein